MRIVPLENAGSTDCGEPDFVGASAPASCAARFQIETAGGEVYSCRSLVIAAGGSSYPASGSDGSLLKVFERDLPELTVCEPKPSLVPIFVENYPFGTLSGIGFHDVEIKIFEPKIEKSIKACPPLRRLAFDPQKLFRSGDFKLIPEIFLPDAGLKLTSFSPIL